MRDAAVVISIFSIRAKDAMVDHSRAVVALAQAGFAARARIGKLIDFADEADLSRLTRGAPGV